MAEPVALGRKYSKGPRKIERVALLVVQNSRASRRCSFSKSHCSHEKMLSKSAAKKTCNTKHIPKKSYYLKSTFDNLNSEFCGNIYLKKKKPKEGKNSAFFFE